MTTSITDSTKLEVHILGAGKGESIVIKLPNGQWGVVDCYASSAADPDSNPTRAFLKSRGVEQLEFLCLTHPHDDHFSGMSTLIDEFQPREFWRPSCLAPELVRLLAKYYAIRGIEEGEESLTASARELVRIYSKVRTNVLEGRLKVQRGVARMTVYPVPARQTGEFQIDCLAPSGTEIEVFEGAILGCLDERSRIVSRLTRSHHNRISLVLRLVYGQTRVLLCGDLEREGWEVLREDFGTETLTASAVKVGHHGSPNGYCDGLWRSLASNGRPVAVFAPSWAHRLPKIEAIEHISQFASTLYATCDSVTDKGTATTAPTRAPLESRIAMRAAFSTKTPRIPRSKAGCCSLIFDELGNCQIELTPPALQIDATMRTVSS
jgi:hypothetical protein